MCVEVSAVQYLLISSLSARKIYVVRQLCFCFSFFMMPEAGFFAEYDTWLIYLHSLSCYSPWPSVGI